jgi:putative membrane protein
VDVAGSAGHDHPEGGASVRKALLAVGPQHEARLLLRVVLGEAAPALTKPPRRAWWKAPLSYHYLAAGHDDAVAMAVTGRLRRVTMWLPLAKTQSVRLVQGPWQRRLRLATVHLDAAGRHVRAEFAQRSYAEARPLVDELAALSRSARRRARLPVPLQVPPAGGGTAGDGRPGQGTGQAATAASPVNAAQSDA